MMMMIDYVAALALNTTFPYSRIINPTREAIIEEILLGGPKGAGMP